MSDDEKLERFAEVAYAALCEVGCSDIFAPAFIEDGVPYLEFDTDDHPEGSDEFRFLLQAEQIALAAVGVEPQPYLLASGEVAS